MLHSSSFLHSWDITLKRSVRTKERRSCRVSEWRTPRIGGARRRRILACEWHITMSCGRELFNYSQSFLSFGRLQAWIHAIDLWKRILVEVEIDYGSRSPWSAPNCGLFVFQQLGNNPPPSTFGWGHSYFIVRGEILEFIKDEFPWIFFCQGCFHWTTTKIGGSKTIRCRLRLKHHWCWLGVNLMIPQASYEKLRYLGFGVSEVRGLIWFNMGEFTRSKTSRVDILRVFSRFPWRKWAVHTFGTI